jgi:diguanylate cyclase (GGDEF)-like protein
MENPTDSPLVPLHRALLIAGCLTLVGATALLDEWTGPHLSFGVFYLIPVVVCAWWGGFAPGILVAIAGTIAWCAVDHAENPNTPAVAGVWNGVVRFGTLVLVASLAARVHAGVRRERWLARTDPLTGAANARHFYEIMSTEAVRAHKTAQPLTLAYVDLDDFKQVNDKLGHAAGDEVLIQVVRTIHTELAGFGALARLGGDEFAVLLPELSPAAAAARVAQIHARVTEELTRRKWPVGVSVGAVTFPRPGTDIDRMIQRADILMYAAKRKGKRRVEHAIAAAPSLEETPSGQRRAMARVLDGRPALVRPEGMTGGSDEFATVLDLTAWNVSLHLEHQFQPGTVLVVEPLATGARTLLVRVERGEVDRNGWLHHCAMSARLSEDELQGWVGAETIDTPGPPRGSVTQRFRRGEDEPG